jgi:hypothetical protein
MTMNKSVDGITVAFASFVSALAPFLASQDLLQLNRVCRCDHQQCETLWSICAALCKNHKPIPLWQALLAQEPCSIPLCCSAYLWSVAFDAFLHCIQEMHGQADMGQWMLCVYTRGRGNYSVCRHPDVRLVMMIHTQRPHPRSDADVSVVKGAKLMLAFLTACDDIAFVHLARSADATRFIAVWFQLGIMARLPLYLW